MKKLKWSSINEPLDIMVNICKSYDIQITKEIILNKYNEEHRHWHNIEHIFNIFYDILDLYENEKINFEEYKILVIVDVFHDIIYDINSDKNEEKSAYYMKSLYKGFNDDETIKRIFHLILNTKMFNDHKYEDKLSDIFNSLDTKILNDNFENILDWENKIYNEYKTLGLENYKKGRINFLEKYLEIDPYNNNIIKLIHYLNEK